MSSSTSIEDLPPDVLAHVLHRVDWPALIAFRCTSSHFQSPDPSVLHHVILNSFPSLRNLPLSSLSFFLPRTASSAPPPHPVPTRIISAVDIFHAGKPVFSTVIHTDSSFISWVEIPEPIPIGQGLELSWIVVDPSTCRAANLSSRKPVVVDPETSAKYVTVVDGHEVTAVVNHCKLYLYVVDAKGETNDIRDSLGVLGKAMEGRKRVRYEEYWKMRKIRRLIWILGLSVVATSFLILMVLRTMDCNFLVHQCQYNIKEALHMWQCRCSLEEAMRMFGQLLVAVGYAASNGYAAIRQKSKCHLLLELLMVAYLSYILKN